MEEALRAAEERFRTLVQFSFDVYWETDAQHGFVRQDFANALADAPRAGSEIGKTRWEVPYLEPDEEAWRKHRAMLDAHVPEGIGIGLSISRSIVEAHGGQISVSANAPHGAVFRFSLPAAEEQAS